MNVYADYAYYRDAYFGEMVPEEDFAWIARRASRELDMICRGKIEGATDAIRDACCAVCEVLHLGMTRGGAEIQAVLRERVGDIDFSYAPPVVAGLRGKIIDVATLYLWHTGLLSWAAPFREGG